MAIVLMVGQQKDLNMSAGVDADYTYALLSASEAEILSLDANGVVEALKAGSATVIVTRNSDDAEVDRLKIVVKDVPLQVTIKIDEV